MDIEKIPSCAESTLTQRYQTTIPAPVRKALRLEKNDKIRYIIESDNKVVISRIIEDKDSDPILGRFLKFLERDMENNPNNIRAVTSKLVNQAKSLVEKVEIDLDAPLLDEEE